MATSLRRTVDAMVTHGALLRRLQETTINIFAFVNNLDILDRNGRVIRNWYKIQAKLHFSLSPNKSSYVFSYADGEEIIF